MSDCGKVENKGREGEAEREGMAKADAQKEETREKREVIHESY